MQRKTSTQELLAKLDRIEHVSIGASKAKDDLLLVTLEMPYPVDYGGRDSVGWGKYQWTNAGSDGSTKSAESRIAPRALPSHGVFHDLVKKHQAELKDVRWSVDFACRALGGVAVESEAVATVSRSTTPSNN